MSNTVTMYSTSGEGAIYLDGLTYTVNADKSIQVPAQYAAQMLNMGFTFEAQALAGSGRLWFNSPAASDLLAVL